MEHLFQVCQAPGRPCVAEFELLSLVRRSVRSGSPLEVLRPEGELPGRALVGQVERVVESELRHVLAYEGRCRLDEEQSVRDSIDERVRIVIAHVDVLE